MARRLKSYVDHLIMADVLVVGGGLAGTSAAIKARETGARVILVDKGVVARSGVSVFAAGVYSVRFPEDDKAIWMEEMLKAGEYLNDQYWVEAVLDNVYPVTMQIDRWGEEHRVRIFEKDENGFIKRKSRGHIKTHHIVVNSLPMMDSMRKIAQLKGVELVERVMATHLIVRDGRAIGILGLQTMTGELYLLGAKAVILASGGCGLKSVYIGHRNLTGDSQAMAMREGAILRSLEQTGSNTVSREHDIHGLNLFVGSGGKFVNALGEEFMWRYHPVLGSRGRQSDLVVAFSREVSEGRGPVYLDMRGVFSTDRQLMRKILPETFMLWDKAGIDPFAAPIEWMPAFRLKMGGGGGLDVNTRCETNLEALYAAGDTCCAPHHGTYTFGGMNLAFAAVSGVLAGAFASENAGGSRKPAMETEAEQVAAKIAALFVPAEIPKGPTPDEVTAKLQRIIIPYPVTYLRTAQSLKKALSELSNLKPEIDSVKAKDSHELVKAWELKNMSVLAEGFLRSALAREESRGYHYREDFPWTDNRDWLKWIYAKAPSGQEMKIWTEEVPTPFLKPEKDYDVPPGRPQDEFRRPA
ncbi:MAG: FAD-binding protein [Deltaproteobacteria bacterium]|nr:FAD-binding protein [Deltaproteobacteria bacterium]